MVTAAENAIQFGQIERQGPGPILGMLAACSVAPARAGRNRCVRNDLKVSASVFADLGGTAIKRVMRHHRAWDLFAVQAGLPLAAELKPEDVYTFDLPPAKELWTKAYRTAAQKEPADPAGSADVPLGGKRKKPPPKEPEPASEPTRDPGPLYRRSTTVSRWEAFLDDDLRTQALANLKRDLHDAREADDQTWVETNLDIAVKVRAHMDEMVRLMTETRTDGLRVVRSA